MASTTLTIRMPVETKKQLESLAEATGRSQAYLALAALQRYLDIECWQVAEILQGLKEADAGDFATDEEIEAAFSRMHVSRH